MSILFKVLNALSQKSDWELRTEILNEFGKKYELVKLRHGERPHWWHVIHVAGERYYVKDCPDDTFKKTISIVRKRYNVRKLRVYGELATPNGRAVRI